MEEQHQHQEEEEEEDRELHQHNTGADAKTGYGAVKASECAAQDASSSIGSISSLCLKRTGTMQGMRLALDSMFACNPSTSMDTEAPTPPCSCTQDEISAKDFMDTGMVDECTCNVVVCDASAGTIHPPPCPASIGKWSLAQRTLSVRELDLANRTAAATPLHSSSMQPRSRSRSRSSSSSRSLSADDEDCSDGQYSRAEDADEESMDVEYNSSCTPYSRSGSDHRPCSSPTRSPLVERPESHLLSITKALAILRQGYDPELSTPPILPMGLLNIWRPRVPSDPSQIIDRVPSPVSGGPPARRPTHRPIYSQLASENGTKEAFLGEPLYISPDNGQDDLTICNSTSSLTAAYNMAFEKLSQLRHNTKPAFYGNEEPTAVYSRRIEPGLEETLHHTQVIRSLADQFFFYKNMEEYLYDVEDSGSELSDLRDTYETLQESMSRTPGQQQISQKIAKIEAERATLTDGDEQAAVQDELQELYKRLQQLQSTVRTEVSSISEQISKKKLELEASIARRDEYITSSLPSHMTLDDVILPSVL